MQDPNRLSFFLEPGHINLYFKEGQFAEAEITGSKTQLESKNLKATTKPYDRDPIGTMQKAGVRFGWSEEDEAKTRKESSEKNKKQNNPIELQK